MASKETQEAHSRTCQYCGNEVDPTTKVCSSCGSRKFHTTKKTTFPDAIGMPLSSPVSNIEQEELPENRASWIIDSFLASGGSFLVAIASYAMWKIHDNSSIINPDMDARTAQLLLLLAIISGLTAIGISFRPRPQE